MRYGVRLTTGFRSASFSSFRIICGLYFLRECSYIPCFLRFRLSKNTCGLSSLHTALPVLFMPFSRICRSSVRRRRRKSDGTIFLSTSLFIFMISIPTPMFARLCMSSAHLPCFSPHGTVNASENGIGGLSLAFLPFSSAFRPYF